VALDQVRAAWRVSADGRIDQVAESIAAEAPWTLMVNGREWVTLIATPDHLEELAIGYLANEGLIADADAVTVLVVDVEGGQIWLRIPGFDPPSDWGRRVLTSCCGRGRPSFYFLNDQNVKPVGPDDVRISAATVVELVAALDAAVPAFRQTGGLHSVGLARNGRLLCVRSDVGRHNALDKAAGWLLREQVPEIPEVAVFSGRLSSEVVIKAARMRIPVIVTHAAPTTLGCELADALGLTAVGFVRDGRQTIYTHPERITTGLS
jgi:FdhD protein